MMIFAHPADCIWTMTKTVRALTICQIGIFDMNGWILGLTLAVTLVATSSAAEPPSWSPYRHEGGGYSDEAAEIASKRITWPQPVCQVDFLDQPELHADQFAVPSGQTQFGPAAVPSHQILAAPNQLRPSDPHHLGGQGIAKRPPSHPLHPNYRLHHQVQAPPATIPGATRREAWKTPYSYGHFGASHTRSWSLHNGYRDAVTEWRQK